MLQAVPSVVLRSWAEEDSSVTRRLGGGGVTALTRQPGQPWGSGVLGASAEDVQKRVPSLNGSSRGRHRQEPQSKTHIGFCQGPQ